VQTVYTLYSLDFVLTIYRIKKKNYADGDQFIGRLDYPERLLSTQNNRLKTYIGLQTYCPTGYPEELIKVTFQYSLSVLEIYSICYVHYRFLALAINVKTQSSHLIQ